eukprot:scaffold5459_cov86-Skeletonema_dohrnii-CCMP3373.AAC.3
MADVGSSVWYSKGNTRNSNARSVLLGWSTDSCNTAFDQAVPAKDVMYFGKFDITWFWIDDVGPLEYAAAKKIFNRMLEVGGKDPCHFIHPLQRQRSNQWSNQLDLCLQNIKVMWEAL